MGAATSGSTVKQNDGLFRNQCQGLISALRNLMRCTFRVKLFAIKKQKKTREGDIVCGYQCDRVDLKWTILNCVSAVTFGWGYRLSKTCCFQRNKEKAVNATWAGQNTVQRLLLPVVWWWISSSHWRTLAITALTDCVFFFNILTAAELTNQQHNSVPSKSESCGKRKLFIQKWVLALDRTSKLPFWQLSSGLTNVKKKMYFNQSFYSNSERKCLTMPLWMHVSPLHFILLTAHMGPTGFSLHSWGENPPPIIPHHIPAPRAVKWQSVN